MKQRPAGRVRWSDPSIITASGLAAPERRAEVIAGFFLAGYADISVPVLGLGVLDQWVEPKVALLAFAGLLLAGLATSARSLLGGDRPAGAGGADLDQRPGRQHITLTPAHRDLAHDGWASSRSTAAPAMVSASMPK